MLIDQLKAMRRVSVPLAALLGPDPAAIVKKVREAFDSGSARTPIPMVRWDIQTGLQGMNQPGKLVLTQLLGSDDEAQWGAMTSNPATALSIINNVPGEIRQCDDCKRNSSTCQHESAPIVQRGSIVFFFNAQRYLEDKPGADNAAVIQGIWNLRDPFKSDRRSFFMLGPAMKLPPELAQDVVVVEDPYPTPEELRTIVERVSSESGSLLDDKAKVQAVDAARGLHAFGAEQNTAMALTKDGLDVSALWESKIVSVEQTIGLTIDRGSESFADVGGLEQFKKFGMQLITGGQCPLLFIRVDEIEKMLGGIGTKGAGDNTGVSQDALGVLLREMEDNDWPGLIALGHAGCGKSLVTKGLANTASKVMGRRVLSTAADLGAMKGGTVGTSETNIRAAMRRIKALAGKGRACFVATCNDLDVMPPALRRRFRLGIWFFDLPDEAEKQPIWQLNLERYKLTTFPKVPKDKPGYRSVGACPEDVDWTGADIRNVCDNAWRMGISLIEAAKYIVPVAKSDPEAITRLRKAADNRFLSASYEGAYQAGAKATKTPKPSVGRARALTEDEE